MKHFLLISFTLTALCATSQITVNPNSLPDQGDNLSYTTVITGINGANDPTGINMQWNFSGFTFGPNTEETYENPINGANAASFPSSNILFDFLGMEGYGTRTSTEIELIGVAGNSLLQNLPFPIVAQLESPFLIRKVPLEYGDAFQSNSSYEFVFAVDQFPALDNFLTQNNPIPNSSIDSIKIIGNFERTDNVNGWGSCFVQGMTHNVLKLERTDSIYYGIEAYAVIPFLGGNWFDITSFVPENILNISGRTIETDQFLLEQSKEFLAVFTKDSQFGNITVGQVKSSLLVGQENIKRDHNLFTIFPNPASNVLFIENIEPQNTIQVLNGIGEVVKEVRSTSNTEILDISTLPLGHYTIRNGNESKMFIKQ